MLILLLCLKTKIVNNLRAFNYSSLKVFPVESMPCPYIAKTSPLLFRQMCVLINFFSCAVNFLGTKIVATSGMFS